MIALFLRHYFKLNIFSYCNVGQIQQEISNINVNMDNSYRTVFLFKSLPTWTKRWIKKISGSCKEIILICSLKSSTLKKKKEKKKDVKVVKNSVHYVLKTPQRTPLNFIHTEHFTTDDSIKAITTHHILLHRSSNAEVPHVFARATHILHINCQTQTQGRLQEDFLSNCRLHWHCLFYGGDDLTDKDSIVLHFPLHQFVLL